MEQFMVGVADVWAYDDKDNLVLKSEAMVNTSVETSTGSTEISGGKRNQLRNIYYHTARLNVTLENTVYDMEWIKQNTGAKETSATVPFKVGMEIKQGDNTLPDGANTPVPFDGSKKAYAYLENDNGKTTKFEFNGNKFNVPTGSEFIGKKVCVTYYANDYTAKSIEIPAGYVPKRLRVVMSVDLSSNKQGEGVIGEGLIEIPVLQLSGAQTINMTADGYSTTSLTGMAIAFKPTNVDNPCQDKAVYAKITTRIYDAAWYDGITDIVVSDSQGGISIQKGQSKQLDIIGIVTDEDNGDIIYGNVPVVMSDLTYTVDGEAKSNVTVDSEGKVTVGASATVGKTATVTAKITDKPEVTTAVVITVANGE